MRENEFLETKQKRKKKTYISQHVHIFHIESNIEKTDEIVEKFKLINEKKKNVKLNISNCCLICTTYQNQFDD